VAPNIFLIILKSYLLLDKNSMLAPLVPKPKVNLTLVHVVFIGIPRHLNSKHRI
ncbi:MAG: hypothetical protein ACI88A_005117, partial [Paraglaciecola sp.]